MALLHFRSELAASLIGLAPLFAAPAAAQDDPYEHYVLTSRDFQRVRQDKDWCYAAFPSWTYMPWTYRWNIGYTEEAGQWAVTHGYNGAFVDRGRIDTPESKTGRLDWINQFQLRFYMDHTAAKGDLHLWDGGGQMKPHAAQVHGNGVRIRPVNAAMLARLQGFINQHTSAVRSSPYRCAYALDDEVSWGHFVHPCMWCITDDPNVYPAWLHEIYGDIAPQRTGWITYEDIRPKLRTWTIGTFDASPLMDQWTFNDSYWNNFLGDLVEYANRIDPNTPCGIVGAQTPNAFGGYDYAKLMRKVQFIEAYNQGSSQAVIRSLNPHNALPTVTSHFFKSVDDTIWQVWYYLAHGNRGFIGWVDGWFDGPQPKDWHAAVAPHYLEAGRKIGPLLAQAEWLHDGVALYYSQASLQLGWILDAEAHGKTWINRNSDYRLGAAHLVRHAWENMLRDAGLQYSLISYADVIEHGVPAEFRVLILPACLCLSDAEARRIRAFCEAGGTVIADYLPGLWDQHGRGRAAGGVLDELFGVRHDPRWTKADLFGGKLWCEVDQDANFEWKTYAGFLTNRNTCIKDESGFNKAARPMGVAQVSHVGQGTAVLMNLSPQWYNAYREAGKTAARKRDVFIRNVTAGGPRRWVELRDAGEREFGYEITYWRKADRTIVCVCFNPEVAATSTGGGNAVGLKTETIPVKLAFTAPVHGVRDERGERDLGDGQEFSFDWRMNEALIVSFDGPPPTARDAR